MTGIDRVKEQILEQADIGEIVSQYVHLQNRGGRLFGLCPFHKEKTPSFSVNPDRGFFHCFGCGKGGNAIDFVMGVENLTYSEARSYLATKLGIPIESPSGPARQHAEIDRFQVMDQSAQFYANCLQNTPNALQYLASREMQPQEIKQYGLGFAPKAWDHLLQTLRKRKIPDKVMVELGLIIPRKDGSGYYDRFRDRILFPIRNTLGRVIAFGGRSLDPNEPAKYLNSNDTSLFNKSKVLYLLDRAKEVLKDRGAVLVEGYMDAISLHMRGFQQAVASLGTALTLEHIHILRRYTKDFILLYDGDSAGIRAALRGVELFFESGHAVRVVLLPEGMDPDDFVRKHGAEELQKLLENAREGFDFYVRQAALQHDANTTQGKIAIVEAMLPLFARINDPLIQRDCIVHLARQLGNQEISVIESTIKKNLQSGKYKTPPTQPEKSQPIVLAPKSDPYAVIKEPLLRLLAFYRGLISPASMSARHAELFFSPQQIDEVSELLKGIFENSVLDHLLLRLLQFENRGQDNLGNERNQAARMAQVFPENKAMSLFISVIEREPLPSSEADLTKMRNDLLDSLQQIREKQIRTTIMKQATNDPQKALQAMNDRITTKRESTQS